jgi:hypothetical protein
MRLPETGAVKKYSVGGFGKLDQEKKYTQRNTQ